jgi:hypothetical protein
MQRASAQLPRIQVYYAKFDGLPGDTGLPYVIKDGVHRFDAVELVMCVYHGSKDFDRNHGRQYWLKYGLKDPFVKADHIMCLFPVISSRQSPGLTFRGVLYMLNVLPNSAAPVKRLLVENFERYVAGDPLLHVEISSNALSDMPINSAARTSAAAQHGDSSSHFEPTVEPETSIVVAQQFEKMLLSSYISDSLDRLYAKWDHDEACLMQNAASSGKVFFGNCYACWNPLFPGLIKIGWTGRSPMQRVRELSGTGMPEPFQLFACINCYNPQDVEKQIHAYFAADRKYGKKKEFFFTSMIVVDHHFENIKRKLAGVVVPFAEVRQPKRKIEDVIVNSIASLEERIISRLDTLLTKPSTTNDLK